MEIGLVGAPNTGKSTFFNAATLQSVETGNRPFVTIKPNQGTAYVKVECPHLDLKKKCQCVIGYCVDGKRFVPIKLWDVAGLVPNAWQGKGLGNQFLSDVMVSNALIQIIDVSGKTDVEGNKTETKYENVKTQVEFLEKEIDQWMKELLKKNWGRTIKTTSSDVKSTAEQLSKNFSGLRIETEDVKRVLAENNFDKPDKWNEQEILKFVTLVRKKTKPMIFACNKIDSGSGMKFFEKLKKDFPKQIFIPCSAESELALKKANKAGLIKYISGESDFTILKEMPESQKKALEFIKKNVLQQFNGTGVQKILNKVAFDLLNLIVAYPVQDQNKWASGKGHILPDAYLLPKGSNPVQLAFKIHTDFATRFISSIDCRTGKLIGKDTELPENAVVKINLKN